MQERLTLSVGGATENRVDNKDNNDFEKHHGVLFSPP